MKHSKTNEQVVKIEATEKTKQALLELMDLKIENDMEKVLNKIDAVQNKMETQFSMMKWALGIGLTFLSIGLAILGIIIKFG